MFLVLGTLAIVTAIGTVILGLNGKNPEVLRFISVSLTALTVCAFYQMDAQYVAREDWSALMDTNFILLLDNDKPERKKYTPIRSREKSL